MPVVDTSWLVALFTEEDEHHAKAAAAAREPGTYWIPHVVLSEFLSLTRYRLGADVARRAHREIRAEPAFQVTTDARFEEIDALYQARPALSYVDCVGISTALRLEQALLTFDGGQARAWRKAQKAPG